MKIEKLEDNFIGRGEVGGFHFKKIFSNTRWYIYKVSGGLNPHYEVFLKKSSPVCINFEEKIYSETHEKEHYPKANSFGRTAWCCKTFSDALECTL